MVRKPASTFAKGITEAQLGAPDYHRALYQHSQYCEILRSLGLEVIVLEADPRFPDSVFVEDVALCTSEGAVLTRPGATSRRKEVEGVENTLRSLFEKIERIQAPGTLDAGDVMMAGSYFFIGLSDRTNEAGANQLADILKQYSFSATTIHLNNLLHLKTGVSYLEQDTFLVSGEFIDHPAFEAFKTISVEKDEAYAANSLWINDTILVPAGYPITQQKIEEAGYATLAVEASEFRKMDGGLSCLSLRF